jgi:hypothetical protein
MMGIGARRLRDAERVRSGAEARLMAAVEFAVGEAISQAQEARLAINKNNWGEAQTRLSRANDLVTLIEQVAPEGKRSAVGQVRNRLNETQRLTGERSQDALASLDSLITDLDGLREKKSE